MKTEGVVKKPPSPLVASSGEDDYQMPEFASPELNAAAFKLRTELIAVQHACEQTLVDPQTARLQGFLLQMQDQCVQTINHLKAEVALLEPGKEKKLIHHLRNDRIGFSCWLEREITRLVEDDPAARIGEVFRECFERLDLIAAEAKETILVVQDPERFIPHLDDSFFVRSVKRLKRWRRNIRRLLGAGSELKREVPFRRLVYHHCSVILPQRLAKAANLIGAQTLLGLRSSRYLYDRFDQEHETIVTAIEAGSGSHQSQSELLERVDEARQAMLERRRSRG